MKAHRRGMLYGGVLRKESIGHRIATDLFVA